MDLYLVFRDRAGADNCAFVHNYQPREYGNLPVLTPHMAWAIGRYQKESFGLGLANELEVPALTNARNAPLARELAAKEWAIDAEPGYRATHIDNLCRLMLYDGDWKGVSQWRSGTNAAGLRGWYTRAHPGGRRARRRPGAGRFRGGGCLGHRVGRQAGVLLRSARKGPFRAGRALAAGREDLAKPLLNRLETMPFAAASRVIGADAHRALDHQVCLPAVLDMLGRRMTTTQDEYANFVYLDLLRHGADLTLPDWQRTFAQFNHAVRSEKYMWSVDAKVMLRLGRLDEAEASIAKFYPEYAGVKAFHRAVAFQRENAARLAGDWKELPGHHPGLPRLRTGGGLGRPLGRGRLPRRRAGPRDPPGWAGAGGVSPVLLRRRDRRLPHRHRVLP